jgi:hypothetical protein
MANRRSVKSFSPPCANSWSRPAPRLDVSSTTLHVSNDDPNLFIFYENWQSRPELDTHLNKPLLTAFFNRRMDLLEKDVEMHFMTMDSPYDKLSDGRRQDASASR